MTIKDIAGRCGVSVSTVSRVLNNHPDVSEAVRERVLQVVKELHYVPNNSARDLVKSQADDIGLVVRGVGNPFFTELIRPIERTIVQAGYTLTFHQINTEDDELLAGAGLVRSKKLRGLIFLGGCFDYAPERAALLDVPFVCCSYTNSFGMLRKENYSSVTIDDRQEARRAVEELLRQGHKKIAILLDSVCDRSISQLRYMGYCGALSDAGLAFDAGLVEETQTFDMAAAYAGMERLIKRRSDFTAVFAIADAMAVAAMKALHDNGRCVPQDCSVIGIDGIAMSAYSIPTLTTLIQPAEEMGETSVQLLLDMIEGRAQNRHILLPTVLRRGGSVCMLRQEDNR